MSKRTAPKSFIKPLRDIVILTQDYEKNVTTGGIQIPDNAEEHNSRALVMAVGPKVRDIEPGQEVLLPEMGSIGYTYRAKLHIVVKEDQIKGICE